MTRTSPREWCAALEHPCVFVNGTVISQPTSSIIGVVLGVAYLISGAFTIRANHKRGVLWAWTKGKEEETGFGDKAREFCRELYGVTLIVWGAALFFATASYQSFTYQLQCETIDSPCIDPDSAELLYDVDVNWAAITYLILQTVGHHLLVVGDVFRAARRYVRLAIAVSVALTLAYALWCFTVDVHNTVDLYSASLVIAAPTLAAQGFLSGWVRYGPRLLACWATLLVSYVVYICFVYMVDEERVYRESGVWFHANDALHVLVIPYGPLLYWASLTAEDAPPGTAFATENHVEAERKAGKDDDIRA